MGSLGNDVLSLNAHKYLLGNDCDITTTGGNPYAWFGFCHTSSNYKLLYEFVSFSTELSSGLCFLGLF